MIADMKNTKTDPAESSSSDSDTLIIDEDFTVDVIEDPEYEDNYNSVRIKTVNEINVQENSVNVRKESDDEESKDCTPNTPESAKNANPRRALYKPFANQRLTPEEFTLIKYIKKLISDGLLKKPYMCPVCEFKMTKRESFITHLDSHVRGEKCHQCRFCRYATFTKASFTRHKAMCNYLFKAQCPHCSFVTTKCRNLRKHIENKHLKPQVFACHKCLFKCEDREMLKKHARENHRGSVYICSMCEFETGNRTTLAKHQRDHGEKKRRVKTKSTDSS